MILDDMDVLAQLMMQSRPSSSTAIVMFSWMNFTASL